VPIPREAMSAAAAAPQYSQPPSAQMANDYESGSAASASAPGALGRAGMMWWRVLVAAGHNPDGGLKRCFYREGGDAVEFRRAMDAADLGCSFSWSSLAKDHGLARDQFMLTSTRVVLPVLSPLGIAVAAGNLDIVKVLIEEYVGPRVPNATSTASAQPQGAQLHTIALCSDSAPMMARPRDGTRLSSGNHAINYMQPTRATRVHGFYIVMCRASSL
jgi:hypothetical protein